MTLTCHEDARHWHKRAPQLPSVGQLTAAWSAAYPTAKVLLAIATALGVAFVLPESLSWQARIAILVVLLCIIGWTLTKLPDSLVAVTGAISLVVSGVIAEKDLYAALGSELIWLLIAAFVIAAVLKASGMMEGLALAIMRPFRRFSSLLVGLTLFIAATAFIIPSTSGRAALLLPVFLALAGAMPDDRLRKPLGLLFPSVILLSAGGSLIGAGAHLIAVDAITRAGYPAIGFGGWILIAFPFALLSSLIAAWLIHWLFVPRDLRGAELSMKGLKHSPLTTQQKRLVMALPVVILLWLSEPWHGFSVALIALAAAFVLITPFFSAAKTKDVFRGIEMELILFLTATVVLAEALIVSGAAQWLAQAALTLLPRALADSLPAIVVFVAVIAVVSHLFITSRTARAAVLIPALALPVAGFGHDTQLIVLVAVLGTGFSQSMMASAKPVAIFGQAEPAPFAQADLTRLARPLMPIKILLLVSFALMIWPHMLGAAAPSHPAAVRVPERAVPLVEPNIDGALCKRSELRLVMVATIAERRMWASGWWHVWNRLQRAGLPVERSAVRTIYREDDMVRLRRHSPQISQDLADTTAVAAARKACGMPSAN